MKRVWRILAAWSTGAVVSVGTPLLAETVDADATVQVEQFHGMKRVENFDQATAPAPVPAPIEVKPSQAPLLTINPAPPAPTTPSVSASTLELAQYLEAIRGGNIIQTAGYLRPELFGMSRLARPQLGSSLACLINHFAISESPAPATPINIHITTEQSSRSEAPSNVEATPKRSPSAEVEASHSQTTAPVVPITPAPPTEAPEHHAPSSAAYPWLRDAATVGGPLLTPIILLAGVVILARFLRGQSGPLIRIEHVGGSSQTLGLAELAELLRGSLPNGGAAPADATAVAAPPVFEEPITAEMFELGPTYEEERLARELQGQQAELGVLQQLFEDNLKLRNELKIAATETTSEPEPAIAAAA